MKTAPYQKLALSLLLSFIVMYAAMFLNVAQADHVYLSLTRVYMTLLMVCPMILIMLITMGNMYDNKKTNLTLTASAIVIFIVALAGLKNQTFISDIQYMRGMISHHSSAIMTSKNASIRDPEVLKLSRNIIESQQREISQMKAILHRMQHDTTSVDTTP